MKTKTILLATLAFIGLSQMNAQIGIGTTEPDPTAVLDVSAEELPANAKKGFLPPRLTTDQRDDIASPGEGLTIYNIDNGCLEFYNGTLWVSACDGSLQPGPVSDCGPGFIAPFITADETEIVDVNAGGNTWMDRNLGAIAPARASGDCYAYGNLHQWGRDGDGHEDRNSSTSPGPVSTSYNGSDFITTNASPNDWLSSPDVNRWTSSKGPEDPCPDGYRVPTISEFSALPISNAADALSSPLALPTAGARRFTGAFQAVGSFGYYWSVTPLSDNSLRLNFSSSGSSTASAPPRGRGQSIRCIKD
jgi:hypothetical protein